MINIVTDHEALKIPCVTLVNLADELPLIREAYEWVKNPGNGALGLAAPQIGSQFRWFVMRNPSDQILAPPVIVVANPKLHLGGKATIKTESCFSNPGENSMVPRWERVTAHYYEVNLTDGIMYRRKVLFSGRSAQIFQHEFDHLRGKCIFHGRRDGRGKVRADTQSTVEPGVKPGTVEADQGRSADHD